MKGQGKLNIILKIYWCRLPTIIKISLCLSKRQLAKVGAFFPETV